MNRGVLLCYILSSTGLLIYSTFPWQSGVCWCVWALTRRPQTLLISLTNWVRVARGPPPIHFLFHSDKSLYMDLRGERGQQGGYERGTYRMGGGGERVRRPEGVRGRREEGEKSELFSSALSPSALPLSGTPTGPADVMSEFSHLSSSQLTHT